MKNLLNAILASVIALTCLAAPVFASTNLDYKLPPSIVGEGLLPEGVDSARSQSPLPSPLRQQAEPPAKVPFIGYAWSLSKEKYIESRVSLEAFRKNWSFDGVMALRLSDNAPAPGIGASYVLVRDKWMFGAGVALLFPQQSKADVTFGITFSVKS